MDGLCADVVSWFRSCLTAGINRCVPPHMCTLLSCTLIEQRAISVTLESSSVTTLASQCVFFLYEKLAEAQTEFMVANGDGQFLYPADRSNSMVEDGKAHRGRSLWDPVDGKEQNLCHSVPVALCRPVAPGYTETSTQCGFQDNVREL